MALSQLCHFRIFQLKQTHPRTHTHPHTHSQGKAVNWTDFAIICSDSCIYIYYFLHMFWPLQGICDISWAASKNWQSVATFHMCHKKQCNKFNQCRKLQKRRTHQIKQTRQHISLYCGKDQAPLFYGTRFLWQIRDGRAARWRHCACCSHSSHGKRGKQLRRKLSLIAAAQALSFQEAAITAEL